MKKSQFVEGKSVWKGLKICTYMFLGMLIAMPYVRTLCDKYFLSYDGFSELRMTKNEKKCQFVRDKVFRMAWISAHIGFWVCWSKCTMLELCVTSTFWSYMKQKDLCDEHTKISRNSYFGRSAPQYWHLVSNRGTNLCKAPWEKFFYLINIALWDVFGSHCGFLKKIKWEFI